MTSDHRTMNMKIRFISLHLLLFVFMLANASCVFSRHEIIPQAEKGPHGGRLVYLDQMLPEYLELVITPAKTEWLFQLYSYNRKMKEQSVSGHAYVEIMLSNNEKKEMNLRSNEPGFVFERHGAYPLEGKIALGNTLSFVGYVTRYQEKSHHKDYFEFSFPLT